MLTPGSSSRGSVSLNASFPPDPFQVPIIDAGLLLSETDVPLMREAVRTILRLASAPAWSEYIISPVNPSQPSHSASDAEIASYIRVNSRSAYHVVGTASMSPKGGKEGSTDPDLTLKGLNGVRIVDASVLVRLGNDTRAVSSLISYFCSRSFQQGIPKRLCTRLQSVPQISLKTLAEIRNLSCQESPSRFQSFPYSLCTFSIRIMLLPLSLLLIALVFATLK